MGIINRINYNNWWIMDHGDHSVLMIDDEIAATFNSKEAARLLSEDMDLDIERAEDFRA